MFENPTVKKSVTTSRFTSEKELKILEHLGKFNLNLHIIIL